ncbi:MAG: hypothetical protein Q9M17_04410 [Mariprofundus sp.]|nr:hypothetical protein [Mariprofundus sp.]
MLAASASTPNNTQASNSHAITSAGWHGVAEGMESAKNAIRNGDLAQAELILTELLNFAPVEIRAWKLLARTQRHLGHIDEGINSAQRALQLQNTNIEDVPLASITIAKLLWQQHEYDYARQMIASLLEQERDNAEWLDLQQQWNREHQE